MTDLEKYVNGLFRHQKMTPELADLREEIISNMTAKRDDLIARGMDPEQAAEKARESLRDVDFLVDGNQLTDVGKYCLDCSQTVLLNCVIFWILSLPMLVAGYGPVSYAGLALVLVSGGFYLFQKMNRANQIAFLSVTASRRRSILIWAVWGLFFLVTVGTMAAVTFGSNLWFGRAVSIDGPYQLASVAMRFYLPLITILVPMTFHSFTTLLLKNRKDSEHEYEG